MTTSTDSSEKTKISPMSAEEIRAIAIALNNGRIDGMSTTLAQLLGISDSAVAQWLNGKTVPANHTIRLMRLLYHLFAEQNINRQTNIYSDALMMSLRPVIASADTDEADEHNASQSRRHRASEFVRAHSIEARIRRTHAQLRPAMSKYIAEGGNATSIATYGVVFTAGSVDRDTQVQAIRRKLDLTKGDKLEILEVSPDTFADALNEVPAYSTLIAYNEDLTRTDQTAGVSRAQAELSRLSLRAELSARKIDVLFCAPNTSWSWSPLIAPALSAMKVDLSAKDGDTKKLINMDKDDKTILLSDNKDLDQSAEDTTDVSVDPDCFLLFNSDRSADQIRQISNVAADAIRRSGYPAGGACLAARAKQEDCPHNPDHAKAWEDAIKAVCYMLEQEDLPPLDPREMLIYAEAD